MAAFLSTNVGRATEVPIGNSSEHNKLTAGVRVRVSAGGTVHPSSGQRPPPQQIQRPLRGQRADPVAVAHEPIALHPATLGRGHADEARISVFASWPPSMVHPMAPVGAPLVLFPFRATGDPRRGQLWLLRVQASWQPSDLHAIPPTPPRPYLLPGPDSHPPRTASTPPTPAAPGYPLGPAAASPEQPLRQMPFRQQQPIIPGVLDQTPTSLHQPPLETRQ